MDRAQRRANRLDTGPAADRALPLFGMPFAVKNLFDVAGLVTLAGSKIERDAPPALRDAVLVERLEAAGAVLVGALNMDEYAYGFTTENSHYGACRNPHDRTRVAGGSSGGSGAAVAAGSVPLALASDTNGSIRVPASLCGTFGLKPTFGRLTRARQLSVRDQPRPPRTLRLASTQRPRAGLRRDARPRRRRSGLRAASRRAGRLPSLDAGPRKACASRLLGGYFHDQRRARRRACGGRTMSARALGVIGARYRRCCPRSHARAPPPSSSATPKAFCAAPRADLKKRRAQDFEPLSRDRFLAGALLPAAWVAAARNACDAAFAVAVWHELLRRLVDVLIAPSTPVRRHRRSAADMDRDSTGRRLPARPQPRAC